MNKYEKHGCTKKGKRHPLYSVWYDMKRRCCDARRSDYHFYGGRGIKVCQRWMSLKNFIEDMGERQKGLTLERIDVDKDYCKENCKWATVTEQQNNKSNNKIYKINGKSLSIKQISEKTGIKLRTLNSRLYSGWSIDDICSRPVRVTKNSHLK